MKLQRTHTENQEMWIQDKWGFTYDTKSQAQKVAAQLEKRGWIAKVKPGGEGLGGFFVIKRKETTRGVKAFTKAREREAKLSRKQLLKKGR